MIFRFSVPLVVFLLVCVWSSATAQSPDEVRRQKRELENIQRGVDEGRKRLDSLKQEETRIANTISVYDQRIVTHSKMLDQLRSQLKKLRSNISDAEKHLTTSQMTLEETRNRFLNSMRRFYLSTPRFSGSLVDVPATEAESNRRMIYLTSLINFESGNLAAASRYFEQSVSELDRLSGQQGKVNRQVKKETSSYKLQVSRKGRQEKALDKLQELKQKEADRILMLQQAAQEMEKIIARLEAAQRRQPGEPEPEIPFEPGISFATLRGQLSAPFRGEITVPYGPSSDPVTRLKSFSPGITIKGLPGANVVSVGFGQVAYTGKLRGYGNFVIINHDNTYYTTYAGLRQIRVTTDQIIDPRTVVGVAGDDGIIKFELRQGTQSLNPMDWIRLETF